ncbi:MAG: hypothetical protein HW387_56 [Parachlamydiales bacterium]|nr:hypothetical protein [Parachlamydiales bacterium]
MKKGKVFFHPIEGSASLTISWSSGPKGDAVEAKKGDGVGFFSDQGDLLCVIFDEAQSNADRQILEFDRYRIEISIKNGRVVHKATQLMTISPLRKRRSKRKQSI